MNDAAPAVMYVHELVVEEPVVVDVYVPAVVPVPHADDSDEPADEEPPAGLDADAIDAIPTPSSAAITPATNTPHRARALPTVPRIPASSIAHEQSLPGREATTP